MAGALEGVRVLDCTQIIAGPLAGTLLSEMGATVVKVEPLEGEPWRLQAELIPKESRNFTVQNRGKLGIAINFKDARSIAVRDALVRWADIVLTNYRPGVAAALGIDYDSVRAIRPDIIYCENTAFGPEGPMSDLRGYDIIAQAVSGLATSNANVRDGQPQIVAFAPGDVVTGVAMAWAMTAALYHRQRTGEGQAINTSLLLTSLFLQQGSREITALDIETRETWLTKLQAARQRGANIEEIYAEKRANTPELVGNIYYRLYQTKDGYVAVGCLGPGPRERFRKAVKITDPRYEEGFDRSPEALRAAGNELTATCEAIFLQRTTGDWVSHMMAHGVPCGPLNFIEELHEDPQVVANGYITDYDHTLLGPMRGPMPIVQMTATPTRIQRASPALGEHTDEVLATIGFSSDDIAHLRQKGIVG
ncbi:MAG: CoA transferase [Chloroflexi bacterium]|nr:CoA transferase [Chloroflexota bacterium]